MLSMLVYLRTLLNTKKGQGMVEYGLIIGLVAVAAIGVLMLMSDSISDLFTKVKDTLDAAIETT